MAARSVLQRQRQALRFQGKDQNFVAALIRSALVDRQTILTRLAAVDERYRRAAERAGSWIRPLETGN